MKLNNRFTSELKQDLVRVSAVLPAGDTEVQISANHRLNSVPTSAEYKNLSAAGNVWATDDDQELWTSDTWVGHADATLDFDLGVRYGI